MTFSEIQSKIIRRWWLILLSLVVVTLMLLPWAKSTSYKASIGIGISFNSAKFTTDTANSNGSTAYVSSLQELGSYLESRFSSIEIQDFILAKSNLKVKEINDKSPFYTVNKSSAGFISLKYSDDNKTNIDNFLSSVPEAYRLIISEWNNSRLETYQIKPMEDFTKTIILVEKPIQVQALPVVLGWLAGIIISIIMPNKWII